MLDIILYQKTCYQTFTTDGIAIKREHEKEKILIRNIIVYQNQ